MPVLIGLQRHNFAALVGQSVLQIRNSVSAGTVVRDPAFDLPSQCLRRLVTHAAAFLHFLHSALWYGPCSCSQSHLGLRCLLGQSLVSPHVPAVATAAGEQF